jgi:hypothetical protein
MTCPAVADQTQKGEFAVHSLSDPQDQKMDIAFPRSDIACCFARSRSTAALATVPAGSQHEFLGLFQWRIALVTRALRQGIEQHALMDEIDNIRDLTAPNE